MKKAILTLVAACLLLSGCSILNNSYYSITPHQDRTAAIEPESSPVSNYSQLRARVELLVSRGAESGLIYCADYPAERLESDVEQIIRYVMDEHPIGAYALDSVDFEVGTKGGQMAVVLECNYLHTRAEILQIRSVADMDAAEDMICKAVEACEAGIVLQVMDYTPEDILLLVENYAAEHPELVMEIPQVNVGVYPDSGDVRVMEIQFSYQTGRDVLRGMQKQVEPLFASAALYVSEDAADFVKYSQLYSFLMERFDYEIATSITPAYSLLRHGVGDSKAFATVYAGICNRVGLECMVVSGTRDGEAWYWNMVCDSTEYFHVDLLRCHEDGGYRERYDAEMVGYVWDYASYPVCEPVVIPTEPADTAIEPPQTEPPQPGETAGE